MSDAIEFFILGRPRPKGSMKAFVPRGRDGQPLRRPNGSIITVTKNDEPTVRPWQDRVAWAAVNAMRARPPFEKEPLILEGVFALARPAGHYAKSGGLKASAPMAPIVPPDVDKLARLAGDAMTKICYRDDARIVSYKAHKIYAPTEGAVILLRVATALDVFAMEAIYSRVSGAKLDAVQARMRLL